MFSTLSSAFLLLLGLVAALLLLAAGAWGYRAWAKRLARRQRRIPHHWPLVPRALVNSEELRVWRWLMHTFPDHRIMVKLPLTRFAMPNDRAQAEALHELLGAVYCTFTICKTDGNVVGCVDVPTQAETQRRAYRIKRSMLGQFALPYWVVKSDNLPDPALMRTEFLAGEGPSDFLVNQEEYEDQAIMTAQASLRSALNRQRQNREHSDFGPLPTELSALDAVSQDRGMRGGWQSNSFLTPMDSREAGLR
ncbi:hypothetical protein [Ottowia thiooxydans]|uniref:hypothetical protein n=1 Tax=Ottowia thiooxydans TaxID=219182 RepID=UPI000411B4B0|nr:hypothetical protein [Ottowia thiooxydans]